jgi:hypothetical protein
MNTPASNTSMLTFEFNFYRFNGRGNKPTPVASLDEANFMRSHQSVEEPLLALALQRIEKCAGEQKVTIQARNSPTSTQGWLQLGSHAEMQSR